jgi:plasmid replication initiation protein
MENTDLTYSSNKLILSRSNFTVHQRILLEAIINTLSTPLRDKIDTNKNKEIAYEPRFDEISTITYRAADLIDKDGYRALRKAILELKSRSYFIETENLEIITGFVLKAEFDKRSEYVKLVIDESIFNICIDLTSGYTTYQTNVLLSLQSIYSIKIYEILAKWRNKDMFYVTVDELRRLTDTADIYTLPADLKKYVLDISLKQINESPISDLNFTYKHVKEGRKIVGFEFRIFKTAHAHENKKMKRLYSLRWDFSKDLISNFENYDIKIVGKNLDLMKSFVAKYGEKKLAEELEKLSGLAKEKNNPTAYIIASLKNQLNPAKVIPIIPVKSDKEAWEMTPAERKELAKDERRRDDSPTILAKLMEEIGNKLIDKKD